MRFQKDRKLKIGRFWYNCLGTLFDVQFLSFWALWILWAKSGSLSELTLWGSLCFGHLNLCRIWFFLVWGQTECQYISQPNKIKIHTFLNPPEVSKAQLMSFWLDIFLLGMSVLQSLYFKDQLSHGLILWDISFSKGQQLSSNNC